MSLQFNNTDASINNMVEILTNISKGHRQINSFGWGAEYDVNAVTVEQYPLLWVFPLPAKLNDAHIVYNFRFIMMDLVDAGQKNEIEVQSDTIQVLRDIAYILRDGYGFDIQFGFQITSFTEKYSDRVTGWFMDIAVDVPQSFGACDAPYVNVFE